MPPSPQSLLAPERRAKILELVRHDKSVLVKDLCVQFGVTSETIRKYLTLLEQEGHLIKTYGGAYIQDGVKNEIDVSIRKMLLPEIKDAIGQRCASLVEEGDTVFLDESTTCLAVARHLLHRDITVGHQLPGYRPSLFRQRPGKAAALRRGVGSEKPLFCRRQRRGFPLPVLYGQELRLLPGRGPRRRHHRRQRRQWAYPLHDAPAGQTAFFGIGPHQAQ